MRRQAVSPALLSHLRWHSHTGLLSPRLIARMLAVARIDAQSLPPIAEQRTEQPHSGAIAAARLVLSSSEGQLRGILSLIFDFTTQHFIWYKQRVNRCVTASWCNYEHWARAGICSSNTSHAVLHGGQQWISERFHGYMDLPGLQTHCRASLGSAAAATAGHLQCSSSQQAALRPKCSPALAAHLQAGQRMNDVIYLLYTAIAQNH